jgi:hypothetical protein
MTAKQSTLTPELLHARGPEQNASSAQQPFRPQRSSGLRVSTKTSPIVVAYQPTNSLLDLDGVVWETSLSCLSMPSYEFTKWIG